MIRVGFVALLFALGIIGARYYVDQPPEQTPAFDPVASYPIERVIKYSFVVRNSASRVLERARFWAYAPVQQTEHQWVSGIESNVAHTIETDTVGNQRMQFLIDGLSPYASRIVDVTVRMRMTSGSVNDNASNDELLGAQPYIEVTDRGLQTKAKALVAASALDTARGTFEWVKSAIDNTGYIEKDRGARYALRHGRGDCSEHMYLYIALSRINGIPARGVAGFVVEHDGVVAPSALHNWSQVKLGGEWGVVDTDQGQFRPDPSRYVAMRILDSRSPFYGDGSQRLFGGASGAVVRMN